MDELLKAGVLYPSHPDRICWGCKRYCPANDLACREERVRHPMEPSGFNWEPQSPENEWRLELASADAARYHADRADRP